MLFVFDLLHFKSSGGNRAAPFRVTQIAMRALFSLALWPALACASVRPFTVADDIAFAQFSDPDGAGAYVQFSPDGQYLAACAERGRIDVNQVEGELRIYRSADLRAFVNSGRPGTSPATPAPLWVISRQAPESSAIGTWRWLESSGSIAFLEQDPSGSSRLMLANLQTRTIAPLTPAGRSVKAFAVHDAEHYVFVLASTGIVERAQLERRAAAVPETGRALDEIIFPADLYPRRGTTATDRGDLWAVFDGRTVQIKNKDGEALTLFGEGEDKFVLSPDGRSLITTLPVAEVPAAWVGHYPPPYPAYPYRLRAGKQDLQQYMAPSPSLASEYVSIDLRTNDIRQLTNAPTASDVGWWSAGGNPRWSKGGTAILLPATFWDADAQTPGTACGALYIDVQSGQKSCVELLKAQLENGGFQDGFRFISDIQFYEGDKHRVIVRFSSPNQERGTTEYRQDSTGRWRIVRETAGVERQLTNTDFQVSVKQGFNDPPVLVARKLESRRALVLWDPNPQLKDIALGEATVYSWKDAATRDWKGLLYKPPNFQSGQRYPLVIQTHGFDEHAFRPSGFATTAMAARELAGAGVLVLQVREIACPLAASDEAPCSVAGYEAGVKQLLVDGLVDPGRIGIIGFSRTCYSVMEALTTSSLHITAASITDGVMEDYFQYLQAVDVMANAIVNDDDATIGARPFGAGLRTWRERSPLFNIDKVNAPLLVVGEGETSLLYMWGPYAALRLLKKPVELVLLNTDEHVLTNPATRLASQGGSVDWFRFWLQDFEDPSSAKVDQYKRWHELRRLQQVQNSNTANSTANSATLQ
jgi:hypothetical protein